MKLNPVEKSVVKAATKKLKEYLTDQEGSKSFSITAANSWLEQNGLDFRLACIIDDGEEKLEIKLASNG
jgi:hypothetical protein